MSDDVYTVLEGRGVLEIAGVTTAGSSCRGSFPTTPRKLSPHPRALRGVPDAPGDVNLRLLPGGGRRSPLLLDGEQAQLADLKRRLSIYKLRAKVTITDATERFLVAAAFGKGASGAAGPFRRSGRALPSPTASLMWTRAFRTSAHGCCCRGPRARQRSMPRVSPAQTAPPTTGCACHWAFPTAAALWQVEKAILLE